MQRKDVVKIMSRKTAYSRETCDLMIEALRETVIDSLSRGEEVILKGFVNFEIKERTERTLLDFHSGEMTKYPASKTIKCKLSNTIKDLVAKNSKRKG